MAKHKGKRISKLITRIMIIVIIMTVGLNVFCAYNIFGGTIKNITINAEETELTDEQQKLKEEDEARKAKEQEKRKLGYIDYVSFEDKGLNTVVTGEEDVLRCLVNMETGLGIDFLNEYKVSKVIDTGDGKVYSLTQNYKGIPVNGCELQVSVDKSGHIYSVSGIHPYISNIDTKPSMKESELREIAKRYIVSEYELEPNVLSIDSEGYQIVRLEDSEIKTGYLFRVYSGKTKVPLRVVLIDGKTGGILHDQSEFRYERVNIRLEGQDGEQTLYVEHPSKYGYELRDKESKLEIYNIKSSPVVNDSENLENYELVKWEYRDNQYSKVDKACVDALANLERTYTFFSEVFGRQNIRKNDKDFMLPVIVNAKKLIEDDKTYNLISNACMVDDRMIIVGAGRIWSKSLANKLDVMGHEYTHGIVYAEALANGITCKEMDMINEGLADVFGEFVEDYSDDNKMNSTCDWVNGIGRSAISPGEGQIINAHEVTENIESHKGIYLVAHPVYLMNKGFDGNEQKRIGNNQLSSILYNIIPRLNAQSDYYTMRKRIEEEVYRGCDNGKPHNLTNAQKECVMDSLDSVGLPRSQDYSLTPTATLNVYDVNYNSYSGGTISIVDLRGKWVVENARIQDGKYQLENLPAGVYTINLRDDELGTIGYYTMAVNDNAQNPIDPYDDSANIISKYGTKESSIALVLDISQSMEGGPFEQVKTASRLFIETMKNKLPNTHIDLITYRGNASLPNGRFIDLELLESEIGNLQTDDGHNENSGTNMDDALRLAETCLAGRENSAVVIMGDGLPNKGEPGSDGDYVKPVIERAKKMKEKGIFIYSFGFFHKLSGSELQKGQDLMAAIANDNYDTNVMEANSPAVNQIFEYIAFQITNPGDTTHLEFRCPVDVSVKYNGQELNSAANNRSTGADFGILSFSGENSEIKIFNLKKGPDYEVIVKGTGNGTMDYYISFADETGAYTDERRFEGIPVSNASLMLTNAGVGEKTRLNVDTDGDGKYDNVYIAGENGKATEEIQWSLGALIMYLILFAAIALILVVIIIEITRTVGRKTAKGVCPACGKKLKENAIFCSYCGSDIDGSGRRLVLSDIPIKNTVVKTVIVLICIIELCVAKGIYTSPAVAAYNQVSSYNYEMAEIVYRKNVEGKGLQPAIFDIIVNSYIQRVKGAFDKKSISAETKAIIGNEICRMEIPNVSEKAKAELLTK